MFLRFNAESRATQTWVGVIPNHGYWTPTRSILKDVEKAESSYAAGGSVGGTAAVGNSLAVPQG